MASAIQQFVQIIIVTWNKKNDVLQLLGQLNQIHYPKDRYHVLVVDNCSTDGTSEAITENFPHVHLIVTDENLGGAGGFNTGMRWALENRKEADYLWLLDNDIMVDSNALAALVNIMETHLDAAICGSRIMNIDDRRELIELGAFIDYSRGDICQNIPESETLEHPDAVFEVDYVAACSLLARTEHIRRMGLWHETFFIYWDDMEWGARFRAAGYKVLASNRSVVFHPSWRGRTADNSAIWRNYYRTRNSLCFFNNYCQQLKKRLLLARMIFRFMMFSANACTRAECLLSKAFDNGIRDFLIDRYGKMNFIMPENDLDRLFRKTSMLTICIFIPTESLSRKIMDFVDRLTTQYPEIKYQLILPEKEKLFWQNQYGKSNMKTYRRLTSGAIPWCDRLRIMGFLINRHWDALLTTSPAPKIASVWGKPVIRLNAEISESMAIEHIDFKQLAGIPYRTIMFLLRSLFAPPRRTMKIDQTGNSK